MDVNNKILKVEKAFTLSDVELPGEIEGLSFDAKNRLYVLNNRGAIIVKGMPKGFYDGYDKEIHEVYIFE